MDPKRSPRVAVKSKGRRVKNKQLQIKNGKAKYSWADLPYSIIEYISTFLYAQDLLVFRRVCKDWKKAATKQCCLDPLLVVLNRCTTNPPYMISLSQHKWFKVNSSLFHNGFCIGSAYGWLIMRNCQSFDLSLLNLFTGSVLELPPWHHEVELGQVCLSSPPTSPDCTVLVIGVSDYSFAFCKLGDTDKWNVKINKWQTIDKDDYLEQVVALQGKFYGVTRHGNLVTIGDPNTNDVQISRVEIPYLRPNPQSWYLQFLLEAQGEILLVLLWLSTSKFYNVEVFRMDFPSYKWVKIVSLGNRLLFVGYNCCFCVDADAIRQPRGNFVCIVNHTISGCSLYDMESQRILNNDVVGIWPSSRENNRFWILPTFD